MTVTRYKPKEKDHINMLLNFFEVYVKIEPLNIHCILWFHQYAFKTNFM